MAPEAINNLLERALVYYGVHPDECDDILRVCQELMHDEVCNEEELLTVGRKGTPYHTLELVDYSTQYIASYNTVRQPANSSEEELVDELCYQDDRYSDDH